jgi:aryl-alcohol dehydrogenase-like predicted oxidoreductase
MRSRRFPGDSTSGSLQFSELGFGCAAVAGRVSRKDSLVALNAAYDAGVTLYDTARSYGYGQSEGVVGAFLQGRRESVVVCTKFGIMPKGVSGWKQKVKPMAQLAVRVFPGLRAVAQKQVQDQFISNQFTPEILRASVETSLRELKTDYIDILLLHAAPVSVLRQHDLLEAMGRLVESGRVRMAGISGEAEVIGRYFAERPKTLTTAQFALNLSNMGFAAETRQNDDLLLVGNHVFGGPSGAAAGKATLCSLHASADLPAELREKLDPDDPQTLPEMVLNCVLRGTGLASIVPAMMQVRHIRSNVRALENCRFTDEEIVLLQSHLGLAGTAQQADRQGAEREPSG